MAATVIFLTTTGTNNWTVPADWNNAANTIEVIGAGGGGARQQFGTPFNGAGGGGGGAYSSVSNQTYTPGATISYTVGAAGLGATVDNTAGGNGGDTSINQNNNVTVACLAKGGQGGQVGNPGAGGTGGAAASGTGTVKNSGGSGGSGPSSATVFTGGGGGGSAAGPHNNGNTGGAGATGDPTTLDAGGGGGAGADGGAIGGNASLTVGGTGGSNRLGAGGGAAGNPGGGGSTGGGGGGGSGSTTSLSMAGGAGSFETLWTSNPGGVAAGPSSGGGGAGSDGGTGTGSTLGGSSGNYGGGGGGGGTNGATGTGNGGNAGQGIIIITYTPTITTPAFFQPAIISRTYGQAASATLLQFSTFEPQGTITSFTGVSGRAQTKAIARAVNNMALTANLAAMSKAIPNWSALVAIQALLQTTAKGSTVTSVPFLFASARLQSLSNIRSLPSTKHFVTISPTVRAYAIGIDRNGSTVYWYWDTSTGLPAVDSDGKPLNPF
jgi:hypothetical protein